MVPSLMSLAWINVPIDERVLLQKNHAEIANECKRRNLEDINSLAQSGLRLICVYGSMCELCHLK